MLVGVAMATAAGHAVQAQTTIQKDMDSSSGNLFQAASPPPNTGGPKPGPGNIRNAPELATPGLTQTTPTGTSTGGKPNVSSMTIQKDTDSSSSNLFRAASSTSTGTSHSPTSGPPGHPVTLATQHPVVTPHATATQHPAVAPHATPPKDPKKP